MHRIHVEARVQDVICRQGGGVNSTISSYLSVSIMSTIKEKISNFVSNNLCVAKPKFLPEDYPDLTGKNVIVTGSNTGVGFETAKLLLKAGAQVSVIVRNLEKMKIAQEKISGEGLDTSKLDIFQADFADLTTISACADKIAAKYSKIHIVIHNAGIMAPPKGSKTKQNYELQLGTNTLAPYLLQKYLDPLVLAAGTNDFTPRVVWVSSNAYLFAPSPRGLLPYDDINDRAGKHKPFLLYGQSKAGMIYNCNVYANKHRGKIITAALNPGGLKTDLQQHSSGIEKKLAELLLYEPVFGAYTELYAALSPDITVENSGVFVRPWGQIEEYAKYIRDGFKDGTAETFNQWTEEQLAPYFK